MQKCVRNFNWWFCELIGLVRLIAKLFAFIDRIDLLSVLKGVFLRFTENRYLHCVKSVQIQKRKKFPIRTLFRHCVNKIFVKLTGTRSRSSFLNFIFNLSWRRPLSYRNQSIDLPHKSMDWFLCDNALRHERVKTYKKVCIFGPYFEYPIRQIFLFLTHAVLKSSVKCISVTKICIGIYYITDVFTIK